MSVESSFDAAPLLSQVETAVKEGKLAASAVENIKAWLTEPRYVDYAAQVAQHISDQKWKELDDAFWTIIPFGTGGRRGKMYPIGSNMINDRTIGESAQGLADYVKKVSGDGPLACAIAYDSRHRSREFAELCSEIMVAAGFKVWFLDGYRSTPALSFTVRYKECNCGIMVTASHNPPSDNAVKAYWSSGVQLLPPHDQGVIDCVMSTDQINRAPFAEALASGKVEYCQEEVDRELCKQIASQSLPGPRDIKILYSPLHGVGSSIVLPALEAAGFKEVESYGPQAYPDPDFTNVPDHVSNPERPVVFDAMVDYVRGKGFDLILATDPDSDRVGCSAPKKIGDDGHWAILTGNQIGALLADYLLTEKEAAGTLTPENYVVKTIVTTELIRRIDDDHHVETVGELLVGFKWIGGVMNQRDPKKFVLGAEESYGFLIGDHARDKDAGVAAMLLAEVTAKAKAEGMSLHEKLANLFRKYGCHSEKTISIQMPGSDGMQRMKSLMAQFRADPPLALAGQRIVEIRDYLAQTNMIVGKKPAAVDIPKGDVVILKLETEGNYVAVRPSGTEPKVKFYMFAYDAPTDAIDETLADQASRLDAMFDNLKKYAGV